MSNNKTGAVLVIGGGIGGIQASLDLAETGFKVYLLEKEPAIGGRMSQLDKTFPTNDCAMCTLSPKLVDAAGHPNIELITYAELEKIKGEAGNFKVQIVKHPRFVDEEKCTGCGICTNNCMVQNKAYFNRQPAMIELAAEDAGKVNTIMNNYHSQPEFLLAILQDIQSVYNYLPSDILRFVSQQLNVPLSKVYGIATYYTAFSLKPRGKYVINVCMGTACHVRGAGMILDALTRHLEIAPGETTKDMMFSLETVNCLGACALGPVIVSNDKYFGKMTVSRVEETLEKLTVSANRRDAETLRR